MTCNHVCFTMKKKIVNKVCRFVASGHNYQSTRLAKSVVNFIVFLGNCDVEGHSQNRKESNMTNKYCIIETYNSVIIKS